MFDAEILGFGMTNSVSYRFNKILGAILDTIPLNSP